MNDHAPILPGPDDWWGRGQAHQQAGRLDEAADCFRQIVEGDHGNVEAMAAWGKVLRAAKRKREAVAVLRQACGLRPGDAELRCELGDAWQDLGYPREALPVYAEAARLAPDLARAWYGAGCAHLAAGEFAAAAAGQREALRVAPDWTAARHNLGSALFKLGQVDEALDAFAEAARGPQPALSRGMIALIIPGSPRAGNREISEARRRWVEGMEFEVGAVPQRSEMPAGGRKVLRLRSRTRSAQDDRSFEGGVSSRRKQTGGKLRVGYVSSFFQNDNWMKPVWSLINRHERREFEIHLFSDAPAAAIKHGYAVHADDHFHDISGVSNELAAEEMARAGLDLLVDLNGYSAGERLPLFRRRPAPVIAQWFNMYATTGMPCFDYLIGDAEVIPPEEEPFYTETIVRVPGSYLSFEVNYPVPEVAPAPGRRGGAMSFGCLAPLYKITPQAVAAWGIILRHAPGATLLLKNTALGSADNRDFVSRMFAEHGVPADRLRLEGPAEHFQFLETYGRIDVALDTFPYNGGTTTTEAIWQGVPVVAFWGDRWVSRTSASILRAGGLGRFVAGSVDEYVRLAVELATASGAREELAELRRGMRAKLRTSPVCDTAAFARSMEGIYRRICGREPR